MEMKFKGAYPKCFESLAQYHDWRKVARVSYPRFGPCTDCTPDFQERMKKEYRCEQPQIKFRLVEDGYEGFFSASDNNKGRHEAAGPEQGGGSGLVEVHGPDGKTKAK